MHRFLPASVDLAYGLYLLVFGGAACACLAGAWRARRVADRDVRTGLVALLATSGGWAATYVVQLLLSSLFLKVWLYKAGLTVGFLTVWAWLYFCSAYSGRSLHRDDRVRWGAILVIGLVTATKLTNLWHGLYFSFTFDATPFPHLQVDQHVLYWGTANLSYAMAAVGFFMLFESLRRVQVGTGKLMGLFGLTALPITANVIGYVSPPLLDVSHEPIGVAAFAIGVLFVGTRFEEAGQVAQHDAPVLVVSETDRLRNYNAPAATLLPALARPDAIGQPVDTVLPSVAALLDANGEDEQTGLLRVKQDASGTAVAVEMVPHPQDIRDETSSANNTGNEQPSRYYCVTESDFGAGRGGHLVIFTDVTEETLRRQAAEQKQAETLRRRTQLLEQTQRLAGAWEADLEKQTVALSEEARRIFQLPAGSTVRFDDVSDFYPPEARAKIDEAFEQCVKEGERYELEVPIVTAEGIRRWVRAVGAPSKVEEGRTRKVAGALQDITDRKAARLERQETREQLANYRAYTSALLNAIDDLFFALDEDGNLQRWNDSLPAVTGYTDEEIEGMSALDFVPPEEQERAARAIAEGFQTGAVQVEVPIVAKDGTERPYEFVSNVVEHPDGGNQLVGIGRDLSERKEMEREIQEQQELLSSITENITDGIYRSTAEEGIVYANPAFVEMFGYDSLDDLRAADPATFYVDASERERLIQKENEHGELDGVEVHYQRKDGSSFIGLLNTRRVERPDDQVYFDGAVTDITERKRREERLRRRREKIEALYEATDRLLKADDPDEVGATIVDLISNTLGYPGVSVRFARDGQLVPGHVSDEAEAFMPENPPIDIDGESTLATVYREGESIAVEDAQSLTDPVDYGASRAGAAVPLGDHGIIAIADREPGAIDPFDLRLVRLLGTHAAGVLDRTEREQALRESERRFRTLFEAAPIGMMLVDTHGRTIRTNPAFQQTFDYDTEMAPLGRSISMATQVDAAQNGTSTSLMSDLLAAARSADTIERRCRRSSGASFWARFTPSWLTDEDGPQLLVMVEDIDERKTYERKLQEAKEEAEEVARLKSTILANMTHEVHTPLTSIISFAGVLKDQLSGQHERYATLVHRGGERLLDTLDSILELSKLEAKEEDLSRTPVRLQSVVRNAADLKREAAAEEDLSLTLDLHEEPVLAYANEAAVDRIFSNLVSNAIKFTPEGGTIGVRVRSEDDWAVIEVEDTGVGIDEDAQDEIFEAFHQESKGLAREHGGSGLGLAIVRRLIETMDGSIQVHSEKDEGSCFTVRLPLTEEA